MHWKNKNSEKYAMRLVKVFGKPDESTKSMMIWNRKVKKAGLKEVVIKDENVAHNFPVKHHDYVYSTKKIIVPPKFVGTLAAVTGSILIDGLKKEVTARCGMLVKNAVTLGFVEDVVKGKVKNNVSIAKKEYARRIINNVTPRWFKDVVGDKKMKNKG